MKTYNFIFFLYTFVFALIGIMIIAFSLQLININDVVFQLNEFYNNLNARISLATAGVIIVFLTLIFAQIVSSKQEREKTIAFSNPSGQVTITLVAVEDLIRRIGLGFAQIKDIRPDVIIRKKKGIEVSLRMVLKSEINIPEFTAQLQDTIKSKIQEIFGIEEDIIVKIHVAKILSRQEKIKERKKSTAVTEEEKEVNIPYQSFKGL